MSCEVVAVGTEILLGKIVDTNSAWIAEHLAEIGINCHRQTVVGDNPTRMLAVLNEALERTNAVIVTGGLGPTQDDLTRDVIAELMEVPLERDTEVVKKIEKRFAGRGRSMPAINLRQADIPVGASVISEMPGTAAGLVCPLKGGKVIYAVPGVPWEMREMLKGTVLPDLAERFGAQALIQSRTLKTWGHSESGLAEDLAEEIERLDKEKNVTLAFQASGIEGVKVRITAKAEKEVEVKALLDREELEVRNLIGDYIFAVDDQTMESVVIEELKTQGLTFATAESLTGGLIGARLTGVSGVSDVYLGSVVAYSLEVKKNLLGIPNVPAVSEESVTAMAEGVCRLLGADVSVSVSGIAGPESPDGQPVGTVWMATSVDGIVQVLKIEFPFDRNQIREFTVITVLNLLRRRLEERRNS